MGFEDRQDLLGHRAGRMTTHYSAAELSRLLEAANTVCERAGNRPELVVLRRIIPGILGNCSCVPLRPASLQSCPSPLRGHLRSTTMFKFAPGEFVEPATIGLKVRNDIFKRLTIHQLTRTPVANCAQLIHAKLTQGYETQHNS